MTNDTDLYFLTPRAARKLGKRATAYCEERNFGLKYTHDQAVVCDEHTPPGVERTLNRVYGRVVSDDGASFWRIPAVDIQEGETS